jgi:hypothetical protein
LYPKDAAIVCASCAGIERACRHRRRFNGGQALGRAERLRRKLGAEPQLGAPLPPLSPRHPFARKRYDALVAQIVKAEEEVRASLLRTIGDLEARARRSKR